MGREQERERGRGREWVKKGCGMTHKLGRWPNFYEGLEMG
jgi:hypothetical protein